MKAQGNVEQHHVNNRIGSGGPLVNVSTVVGEAPTGINLGRQAGYKHLSTWGSFNFRRSARAAMNRDHARLSLQLGNFDFFPANSTTPRSRTGRSWCSTICKSGTSDRSSFLSNGVKSVGATSFSERQRTAILQMNRPPGFNAETILGKSLRSRW